jgi:hypothetical protein
VTERAVGLPLPLDREAMMTDLDKQLEDLELAANDSEMLAGLHWERATREQCRRIALAYRQAAQRVRDTMLAQAA